MDKHYRILGNGYSTTTGKGFTIEIDHASNEKDAVFLCKEYCKQYAGLDVYVEVQTYMDGELDDIYPLE